MDFPAPGLPQKITSSSGCLRAKGLAAMKTCQQSARVGFLAGDSKFIESNKHIPGSSRSDFTKDLGSKPIVAGSVICPRKNSSGVLNGIPMLVASPLEPISDFVTTC